MRKIFVGAFHVLLFIGFFHPVAASVEQHWVTRIKNKQLLRFDYIVLGNLLIQTKNELSRYPKKKYMFFITDDNSLMLDGFIKKNSIDGVDTDLIADSLFVVFFHTDDDYFYTLKKIKDYKGLFYSIPSYHPKTRYMWVDKNAAKAIDAAASQVNNMSMYDFDVYENICQCINRTKDLDGDYVEIGVYKGGSALVALHYMSYAGIHRRAYFLDTFNGMTYQDAYQSSDIHWQGTHVLWGVQDTMHYVERLLKNTRENFNLVESNICQDSLPETLRQIAVCNIDVDLYEATLAALIKVAPLMVKGGIIMCEDPTSMPALGGALVAMDEFLLTPMGQNFIKILAGAHYLLIKIN